jgi:hypothetical protein
MHYRSRSQGCLDAKQLELPITAPSSSFNTTSRQALCLTTPSIMSVPDGPTYEPKDALEITGEHALIVGGFGAVISAIQNTLARQNLGAMGFLTRFGGTTATFSMSVELIYCDNVH